MGPQHIMPQTAMVPLSQIRKNPDNPRTIKDDRFKKLVQSIKSFPEMLILRPIVVDADGMILGGNMRYEACKAAGMDQVPVVRAEALTDEQKREFIIKDNVPGGEWDYSILANEWDVVQLEEWGIDLPGEEIDAAALPDIGTGEESNIMQMTFTLTTEQVECVEMAIKTAKEKWSDVATENENMRGNMLFFICREYVG